MTGFLDLEQANPAGADTPPATAFASAPTLIFPAVNAMAVEYLRAAARRGEQTLCAASTGVREIPEEVGHVILLPMIHERSFADCFVSLLSERAVAHVYCPVATVHAYLRRFIHERQLPISLVGESPVREEMKRQCDLMARARKAQQTLSTIAGEGAVLSLHEVAALLKFASVIYGESNDDKLAAIMGIACSVPPSDVVEIGCLMGRSAFLLLYLATRYNLGTVVTVDPWTSKECRQIDSPPELQAVVEEWDFDLLSEGFAVSAALFRRDRHYHLRLPSRDAFVAYTGGGVPAHKRPWTGQIGLIHIDGNHDHRAVEEDCNLWLPRMMPGAWLVLDDYVWAHGDGPFRVGNALLSSNAERIERAFVCGKALFVRCRAALLADVASVSGSRRSSP